jgi:hypothetical protein
MGLNSLFPRVASSVFSIGLFVPGFWFLFLHLAIDFNSVPVPKWKRDAHWFYAAGWTLLGIAALVALLRTPEGRDALRRTDETLARDAARAAARKQAKEAEAADEGPALDMVGCDDADGGLSSARTGVDEWRGGGRGRSVWRRAYGGCSLGALCSACRGSGVRTGAGVGAVASARSGPAAAALDEEAGAVALLRVIVLSLASLGLSIFAVVTLSSLFTRVPSASPSLPGVLIYTKNSADFAGRVLTLLPPVIANQRQLLVAVVVRFCLLPIFIAYLFNALFPSTSSSGDAFVIALVAVSSVTSGYLNTAAYAQAAALVPSTLKAVAAGWMNVSFQVSVLLSLGFCFALLAA